MNFDLHNWLKDAEKSQQAYQEAIRLNPEDASAHCGLGWALYNLRRYREAEEPLPDAVSASLEAPRLRPDYADAYFGLGAAYFKLNERDKAIAAYTEALRINPSHVPAAANLGWLYFDLDKFAQAADILAHAISVAPKWEAETPEPKADFPRLYIKLGEALAKAGNLKSALKQYRVLRGFDRIAAAKLLNIIKGK
jgi:tetratricopeptide (TPR) repeat protein